MKTSDLTGAILDYWVARAEGWEADKVEVNRTYSQCCIDFHDTGAPELPYSPSTNWAQGGPILEREFIDLSGSIGDWQAKHDMYDSEKYTGIHFGRGKTALEAAMRCYVASKFGDTVEDIPA